METEVPIWLTLSYLELHTLRRMEHTSTQRVAYNKPGISAHIIYCFAFHLSAQQSCFVCVESLCVLICDRIAVTPPGMAREDWKILRALSEVNVTLYPSLTVCILLYDSNQHRPVQCSSVYIQYEAIISLTDCGVHIAL